MRQIGDIERPSQNLFESVNESTLWKESGNEKERAYKPTKLLAGLCKAATLQRCNAATLHYKATS
jgi:hypothetical protein